MISDFIYIPTLCLQFVNVLVSLYICAESPNLSLRDNVKSIGSVCLRFPTCTVNLYKRQLKKKTKIGFQDHLSLNEGQKYCRMLQGSKGSILQYL